MARQGLDLLGAGMHGHVEEAARPALEGDHMVGGKQDREGAVRQFLARRAEEHRFELESGHAAEEHDERRHLLAVGEPGVDHLLERTRQDAVLAGEVILVHQRVFKVSMTTDSLRSGGADAISERFIV